MGLIWREVVGYEGLYEVSSCGLVKSKDRVVKVDRWGGFDKTLEGQIRKQQNRDGYSSVALFKNGKRKNHYTHRLVADAFIPNPNNYPMVNHKDETRDNNHCDNLEWCDHQYNLNYGTTYERISKKLSMAVVGTSIKTGEEVYFSSTVEAGKNGFNQAMVSRCCNNKANKHKNYKWKFI